MSHKIMKTTIPTLTLGAMVGVAQADVLDDAINNAKDAGFTTNVQTRTEKVSSQSEADRLNQEEALRVQTLAKRIQNQVQSAQSSDRAVQTVVTSVLTDQEKESTESAGQNQTIVRENTDAQKAYEESIRAVEAKNAKAQADYEAEKAKIAEENAQAQREYEAKKPKSKQTMPIIKRRMKKLSNALLPKINKHRMRIKPIAKKLKLNFIPKNGLIPRSLRMRKLQALRFVLLKRLIKEL